MPLPVRSIRLEKRTSKSLDTLSGESGEIFFDAGQNTLRIYTANQSDSIVMADRAWVTANTFSGNYNDLTNKPTVPTDINQLSDATNLLFSGDYNDLTNAPDLGGLSIDISTINSIGDVDTETNPLVAGQLLEWDGTNWVNTTVAGFANTDTTYSIAASIGDSGANITLTDSEGDTSQVEIVGGTNVTVGVNLTGDIEVSTSLPSLSQLSDTVITTPQDGQLLGYNSGQWINVAAPVAQGGIELTDLSVATAVANASGSLAYDSAFGQFTFTPPDLSAYANLNNFSVTTSAASAGGSLSYSETDGTFTFRPALVSDFIALTDISVVSNAASGSGALTYSDSTGQFTFTPPDLSGATADVVDDLTPQLGGDLDLNNSDITGTGDINITGTVTANDFAVGAVGAPAITSASTITLTAPDGVTITDDGTNDVVIDSGSITVPTSGSISDSSASSNITFGASALILNTGLDLALVANGITIRGIIQDDINFGKFTGSTGTVNHNTNQQGVFLHSSIASNFTANITGVGTGNDYVHRIRIFLLQGATAYMPTAFQINSVAETVLWKDGSTPTGTANGIDLIELEWLDLGTLGNYLTARHTSFS